MNTINKCKHEIGYKDSNPKIDIYYKGSYVGSTNWYKTCRDAKEAYIFNKGIENRLLVKTVIA